MALRLARIQIERVLGIFQCALDLVVAILADLEKRALPVDERETGKHARRIRIEPGRELEKALSLDASPFIYFYLARAHHQLGDN